MFQKCLFKTIKCVFIKISFVYTFFHIIRRIRVLFKLINKFNWEVVTQVRLTIALLKSLFKIQLVMLSIAVVAVSLVTLVGLFIVDIILNSNIKFTKLCTFLFVSNIIKIKKKNSLQSYRR